MERVYVYVCVRWSCAFAEFATNLQRRRRRPMEGYPTESWTLEFGLT